METLYLDEPTGKLYKYENGTWVEAEGEIDDGPPSPEDIEDMEKQQRQQARQEQEEEGSDDEFDDEFDDDQQDDEGNESEEKLGDKLGDMLGTQSEPNSGSNQGDSKGNNPSDGQDHTNNNSDQSEENSDGSRQTDSTEDNNVEKSTSDSPNDNSEEEQSLSDKDTETQNNQTDTSNSSDSNHSQTGQRSEKSISQQQSTAGPDEPQNSQDDQQNDEPNIRSDFDSSNINSVISNISGLISDLDNGVNIDDIKDQLDAAIGAANQILKNRPKVNEAIGDPYAELQDLLDELNDKIARARRMQNISDKLNSNDVKDGIKSDNIAAKDREAQKERAARRQASKVAAKDKRYNGKSDFNGDLQTFKKDLEKLMKNDIKEIESNTWSRRNRRYTGTPFIMPGKRTDQKLIVPSIGVYFDVSTSWGASDIERGKKAISCLYELQRKGKIIFDLIYFGNRLGKDPDPKGSADINAIRGRTGGATHAGRLLVEDVIKMHYDNVIVMTDSDFDSFGEIKSAPVARLPGAAFFLFRYGDVSYELLQHIQGKQNKVYSI